MSRADEALERARAEAARKRGEGRYAEDPEAGRDLAEAITGPVTSEQLRDWAVVGVDPQVLRSTRAAGAPVTAFKRLLLRILRQYTNELEAQQTRFNVALLTRLEELDRRVEDLERRAR